jgi:uncharacterized ferritin-like protein (DUF455 family)
MLAFNVIDNIIHRLAVINLTHEAKGLDSYIRTRDKLLFHHDQSSLAILEHNIIEEIGHVRFGIKWFAFFCRQDGLDPKEEYQRLYRHYFKGALKPPFHKEFRDAAGMTEDWYACLSDDVI